MRDVFTKPSRIDLVQIFTAIRAIAIAPLTVGFSGKHLRVDFLEISMSKSMYANEF